MPIVIKDFEWKQSEEQLSIEVPLHGVPPNKVDVFTAPQYLKLTFHPFFFEVILLNPIDISQSTCTKTSTHVVFELRKLCSALWDTLEVQNLSKKEKNQLKLRLIEEEHARLQKEREEKRTKKAELKRVAINELIQVDTRERRRIEENRKAEESKALGDINEWKLDVERRPKQTSASSRINSPKVPPKKKVPELTPIPKPRSSRTLQILFTPREFPTPSRESLLEEENEFLSKQAEARRTAGFVDEDLRPEEKNPQYLLARAAEFMSNKNYLGAISALSFGIKLRPKFVDLFLARSESHLKAGVRAVDDCTSALDLYKPVSAVNLHERALCLGRRGVGLYELGFGKQGISELEASLKLEPDGEFKTLLQEYRDKLKEMEARDAEKTQSKAN
ncbi:hypothetical protein YQE_11681, partial [Dendroctonus ponderosae]